MIDFVFGNSGQKPFDIQRYVDWINRVIISEGCVLERIVYYYVNDEELLEINKRHLDHDTLTDIITFDYSAEEMISGEVYISYDRVVENAGIYGKDPEDELRRVMVHGVLHLIGYADKSAEDSKIMRGKEDEKLKMFHVEQ